MNRAEGSFKGGHLELGGFGGGEGARELGKSRHVHRGVELGEASRGEKSVFAGVDVSAGLEVKGVVGAGPGSHV